MNELPFPPPLEDLEKQETLDQECPICLETLFKDQMVYRTTCQHSFHELCWQDFLKKGMFQIPGQSHNPDQVVYHCPLCRHPISVSPPLNRPTIYRNPTELPVELQLAIRQYIVEEQSRRYTLENHFRRYLSLELRHYNQNQTMINNFKKYLVILIVVLFMVGFITGLVLVVTYKI